MSHYTMLYKYGKRTSTSLGIIFTYVPVKLIYFTKALPDIPVLSNAM